MALKVPFYITTLLLLLFSYSLAAQKIMYEQLPCGLYRGSDGSLAYKSENIIDDEGKRQIIYISHFYPEIDDITTKTTYLKNVIDTATFTFLNHCFWKDKNHIYVFMLNSSGGYISMADFGDPATFTPIGETRYAKDKDGVYYYASGKIEEADPATFELLDSYDEFYAYELARDKRHYYQKNMRLDMHTIAKYGLTDFLQSLNPKIPLDWFTTEPLFKNQGQQEDFWVYRLFREEYQPKAYTKYSQPITSIGNTIQFGYIKSYINVTPELKKIFTSGLIYPELIGVTSLRLDNLQQLDFLNTAQVKRYRFWLSRDNSMNPQVYFFELQNSEATEKTSMEDFIKGAKLTFIKNGWIII